MDQATNESTNILTAVDIVNEKRISSSPILKQNDDVGHCYGKNQLTIYCKQEELANSSENYSGPKGAQLTLSGEKQFTCDICEKTFKYRNALNRHKIIHAEEKPFGCDICGKMFNQRNHLDRHRLIHSG